MNIQPIDIILVTYKRQDLLKNTIRMLYERLLYPHRILVVNNDKDDGSVSRYLTNTKNCGYIYDFINLDNKGFAGGLSEGFQYLEKTKQGISEYIITTQDDITPSLLRPKCLLERLLELFKKYESEYGAISCRTQRVRRREVDEEKELIDSPTSLSSCFRIQRSDDIKKTGHYFTYREHWESPEIAKNINQLKKKLGIATHLYVSDEGFMPKNKGFDKDFKGYNTYSPERVNQGELQPYPDIDFKTCVPMKVNNPRDMSEHQKRLAFWELYGFKKSAVMLEALRERHGAKSYQYIQMGPFVNFLYNLARDFPNVSTIVEIGVANGVSTNSFLYGLHDRTKEPKKRTLYSIDIEDRREMADVDYDIKDNWKFIQADSTKMAWDKGEIDILLIDGDHSYEAVKADYNNFVSYIKTGGLILLHDVSWPKKGVQRFYEELGSPGVILPLSPSGMAVIVKK
jgi:predicted O-methyltransferase YrrM